MIAIVDAGPLYAVADADDLDHARCRAVLEREELHLVVPTLVITEAAYLIGSRLGAMAEAVFIRSLAGFEVEPPALEDWDRIADLIVCDSNTCNNTTLAHTWGVESFVRARLTDTVSVSLNETYTRAEDDHGNDLKRRPKHRTDVRIDYRPPKAARFGFEALLVGRQKDVDFSSGGVVYDGSYAVFNLTTSYDLDERVTLYARADNLLDREYEVADGYRGLSRTVIAGVRAKF